jgi:hypothetical protein
MMARVRAAATTTPNATVPNEICMIASFRPL